MTTSGGAFSLTSPELAASAPIAPHHYLDSFGCSGDNRRPVLEWHNPPAGTRSFALTFYDEDAPTGSGFWHWVAYDIPASAERMPSGALPAGAKEANSDFGKPGYFGPGPPPGREHRYTFNIHALDTAALDVPDNATGALAGFFIYKHTLARATFTVKAGPRPA